MRLILPIIITELETHYYHHLNAPNLSPIYTHLSFFWQQEKAPFK
nr:MAG TPA: hypothetical protein [Caudoviricetes sp.]